MREAVSISSRFISMTQDQPHYLFMHYWGKGDAKELAKVIKKSLDIQAEGLNKP